MLYLESPGDGMKCLCCRFAILIIQVCHRVHCFDVTWKTENKRKSVKWLGQDSWPWIWQLNKFKFVHWLSVKLFNVPMQVTLNEGRKITVQQVSSLTVQLVSSLTVQLVSSLTVQLVSSLTLQLVSSLTVQLVSSLTVFDQRIKYVAICM